MLPPTALPAKVSTRIVSQELEWSNVDIWRLFSDFFTIWCAFVFLAPFVKCASYTQDINVRYWMGVMPSIVSWMAVLLILVGTCIHRITRAPSKVAVLISMVGASLTLALTANDLIADSYRLRNTFAASDCRTADAKYELEEAWQAAYVFRESCQAAVGNRTSRLRTIEYCPGYSAMLTKHLSSWRYLAELEEAYMCAGWCRPSTPVWSAGVELRDPCSAVVAEILTAKVLPFATQVSIFGIVKATLTVVFLILMGTSMRHRGGAVEY